MKNEAFGLFSQISTVVKLDKLFVIREKRMMSERLSSRMVKCASSLNLGELVGWQMGVPVKGRVGICLFGSKSLCHTDLAWIAEKTGKTKKACFPVEGNKFNELYEVMLSAGENVKALPAIGFGMDVSSSKNETATKWPSRFSLQFDELVRVLQLTGAILRVAAGAATEEEQSVCRKNSLRTYNLTGVDFMEYLGRPIKIRVLLRLPTAPSIGLRTVIEEAVQGAKLRHIGAMTDTNAVAVWNDPLKDAPVLPDYAARVMMLEPELYRPLIGVETCEEEIKKIPANHKNTKSKRPLVIGRAVDNSGYKRKMTIGEKDLKRHYQIVGQTGTGKSTLLATIILNAIEQGYPVPEWIEEWDRRRKKLKFAG